LDDVDEPIPKLRSRPLRTLVAAKASLFPALLRARDRALCVQDHSTQLVSKQLKLTYPHTWTVYIAHLLAIRRKGHRVNGQAFKIQEKLILSHRLPIYVPNCQVIGTTTTSASRNASKTSVDILKYFLSQKL